MLYGLTYLYRASDFFSIVEMFKPQCVFFTPYWCELSDSFWSLDSDGKDGLGLGSRKFLLTDCYEFGFMGAFGMGYKLIVTGKKRVKECDNKALWATAHIVRTHALKTWRRVSFNERSVKSGRTEKELVVRPGFVCRLESVDAAFVKLATFLEDKIPERVPVVLSVKPVEEVK